MRLFKSINPALAAVLVVALVGGLVYFLLPKAGTKTLVADFPRTVSLYEGSEVKVLGIPVGKVETVQPMGTFVRVTMNYKDEYKVPASAKAAVISPSIVGDRFVQLTPAYRGGPTMPDNAHLSQRRTAIPLELDQIFGSLNQLDVALGPEGANKDGALSRLLDSTARNFGGQGVKFHQTINDLGKLTKTLSDNKDELFGTFAATEKFVNALSRSDGTVRRFNDSLAGGAQVLASDRQELGAAMDNLSTAMVQVRGFVKDNRRQLTSDISGLTRVSNTLVKRRKDLDQILRYAPGALNNLALAYDPASGTLDTRDNLGEVISKLTSNPVKLLCSFVNEATNGSRCPITRVPLPNRPARPAGLTLPRTAPFQAVRRAQDKARQQVDPTLAGLVEARR